jgi:hypothetical protein
MKEPGGGAALVPNVAARYWMSKPSLRTRMSMARITAIDAERGVKTTSEIVRTKKLMRMLAVRSPWVATRRTANAAPIATPPTATINPMSSSVPKTDHHEPRTS